jgi:hypothetical protein
MRNDLRRWAGPIPAPSAADLADRYAASQLVKVYALGIDEREYALTRSVFSDDAVVEGSNRSGPIDEYLPPIYEGAAAYAATQHNMTNQHVELNGDTALVWSDAIAVHKGEPADAQSDLTMGVQYRDTCRRFEDGWRITRRSVVVRWIDGDLPGTDGNER